MNHVLEQISDAGFKVTAKGESLFVEPASRLTTEQRQWLRANKPALLKALKSGDGFLSHHHSEAANGPRMTSTGVPWPYRLEYCPTCRHHPGDGLECPKQGRVIECPESVTCKHHESRESVTATPFPGAEAAPLEGELMPEESTPEELEQRYQAALAEAEGSLISLKEKYCAPLEKPNAPTH